MATNYNSSSDPRAEKISDVLDALSSSIAKTAASESTPAHQLLVRAAPAEPARQLLTEIMLADRWVWRFSKFNGITEGFHTKMEMMSRRAYGFRNFENYRLRVLAHCGWNGVFCRV